jgi:tRNA threonylcarbamoyladenosine biosynthesis protein TsaB
MKLLTLDTATSVFSVAISAGEQLLGETAGEAGQLTAARMVPAIQRLFSDCALRPADLDGFAVTIGPGSFTGLRVGIAFIKGLAYATAKPVVGLSSLALLAMNAKESRIPVCPLFDARKSEVYGGLYRFTGGMETVIADRVSPPEQFLDLIAGETLFLGDGALRYREQIVARLGDQARFVEPHLHNPSAATGVPLALQAFAAGNAVTAATLLPSYLRLSEAEMNRNNLPAA